ncbi:MAG: polysulfide reductase NrfD [Actinomycetota bacterium]|nr:polysulfide reductase NrfD [Actinomycetota bacterium]
MVKAAKADRHAMVPAAEVRSYYDHAVIREPVWTWEIPSYFFAGGLAGAAAPLALAARMTDRPELARVLETAAAAGAAISPILLVADLGRPSRFYNMLRVFKPSSPMSVGSWALAVFAPAAIGTAALDQLGWLPPVRMVAGVTAALLGPFIATYTAVLFADTAVPIWHEAHRELPAVFAGSALASAGAAGVIGLPVSLAGPARRALLAGAAAELTAVVAMERTLGPLASPYQEDPARRFAHAARWGTAGGAALVATVGRSRRWAAMSGGAAVMVGSLCERWAVFAAGRQSARDPRATTAPQRARRPSVPQSGHQA